MFRTLAMALSLMLASAASVQADTKILLNCFPPSKHAICQILGAWADSVEEATDGRVRVTIPAKSMAPPPEQMNSVRGGLFDASLVFNGFIANEVAGPMVAMNPFTGGASSLANSVALWRTYDEFFGDIDEYEGVKLLGLAVNPGANFYSMTDQPILSLSDATNRKMWALPGGTANILKANGGAVVSGPAAQMTEIIQRRVVDGFVGVAANSAKSFGVVDYAQSVTRTPRSIFTAVFSFFISDEKWAELSAEDQAAIMSVSGEAFAELAGTIFDAENQVALAEQDAGAIDVIMASDAFYAELQEAGKPVSAKWIGRVDNMGVDGAAMLSRYQDSVSALQ